MKTTMQMTLTITAESPAEMVTVLQALQVSGVDVPVQVKAIEPVVDQVTVIEHPSPETPPAPKRGRPFGSKNTSMIKAVEKATASPEGEAPPAKLTVVPKEEEPKPKKPITVIDVRTALTAYLAANSEAKAQALLLKHGKADRISLLKPEYYEAVYHAAVTPVVTDFDDDLTGTGVA
jgi:hypothetical protein